MIFVTVGTSSWDFSRLIKEMDYIAGKIDEKVIMQISNTKYIPENAEYFRFTSNEEIEKLFENSRVIVSHAGVGCIISALKHNKLNIVVPRRKQFKEHFDDHQMDIAKELANDGILIVVENIKDLEQKLKNIEEYSSIKQKENKLVYELKKYIHNLNVIE
jgi:beta-1,4-N-acetylglucosaminyltransferase